MCLLNPTADYCIVTTLSYNTHTQNNSNIKLEFQ
jgi:hypothetical protein